MSNYSEQPICFGSFTGDEGTKNWLDVYNVVAKDLRLLNCSIVRWSKRQSLTGRQRRRALLIVDELRLALSETKPMATKGGWKAASDAVRHLGMTMSSLWNQQQFSHGSKWWNHFGERISDSLESQIDNLSYAEELRGRSHGVWIGDCGERISPSEGQLKAAELGC